MEKFMLLDANVGDVLYMRIKGSVTAVKIVRVILGSVNASFSNSSYVEMLVAGEGNTTKREYIGCHSNTKFYRTIEDCINNTNHVDKYYISDEEVAEKCSMEVTHKYTDIGFGYDGVWKFKWDGFMPKRVHIPLSDYNFIDEGNGWFARPIKKSYHKETPKYYDSYEECIADNQVKVVVF